MALITVLGIDIVDKAWSGMELRTAVERTSRLALLRREALQPERCLSTKEIRGRQSDTLSLLGERGRPR